MIVYLGILAAMAPLATDMYLPALPELQAEFGSTTSMTQLTLTMTMMGMAVGQIFAGPISDLRGRKIPLLLGMLLLGPIPAKLAGKVSEASMLCAAMTVQLAGSICLLVAFLTGFSPLWLIILFLCCCFMPISVIGAVSFSLALNGQGRNAGSASALLGFFSMFLGGIMMPAAGFFGIDTGIPMAVIMLTGFVLGMICYYTMIRPAHLDV